MKSGTASIIGRPNAGKSTLINALVGEKISIVSDKPQTTRHRTLGMLADSRGQIILVDTPGIHKPMYRMNQRMLGRVHDSLMGVDLVLLILDGSIAFGAGERFTLEMVKNLRKQTLLLINKIDKMPKPKLLPIIQRYSDQHDFADIIPVSALRRENLDLLLDRIFHFLPEGQPLFAPDQVTDRTERFLASELIREKILERTRAELPYATAVMLRDFDETRRESKNLVVIRADILVEKKTQQGIILGAGGAQLRDLGASARQDLEQLLGCRVYLALTVRTVPKWRDNDRVLNELEL